MTRARAGVQVDINAQVYEWLRNAALDRGLTTTALTNSILIGAFRAGNLTSLIDSGLKQNDGMVNQQNRGSKRIWELVTPGVYRYGDFKLTRVGTPNHAPREGEGWYVQGPKIRPRVFVGTTLPAARAAATKLIHPESATA